MSIKQYIAVLDLETTGFHASGNDRIVEIGIVFLDSTLQEIGSWNSLVNPMRDAGARHVHGIASKWLLDAPVFGDVANSIASALDQCVLVAHNANFDVGFLKAELNRNNVMWSPPAESVFDTMSLAQWVVAPGESLKLSNLCRKYDVQNAREHSALGDARATAGLLLRMTEAQPLILSELTASLVPGNSSANIETLLDAVCKIRPEQEVLGVSAGFIPALVSALPISGTQTPIRREYQAMLHLVFEDFNLTVDEIKSLTLVASQSGLTLEDVGDIHEKFFADLVALAWSDEILTDKEWEQLEFVGHSIGVNPIKIEMAKTGKGFSFEQETGTLPLGLQKGDAIVLTGDMVPSKSEVGALLIGAGLDVRGNISKKVRLVIAADPDSLSGKAAGARKLGIPLISVDLFLSQWLA